MVVIRAIPGALEIIEGRRCRPERPPATADAAVQAKYEKDLQEFINVDSALLVLITTNMTDEILNHVMRLTSSQEVWEELNRLYGESSEDKSYDLCLKFFGYKKEPEHAMANHISALKNIWHELNSQLESKLPDMLLICKILDTLPTEYFAFKSSWLLMTKRDRTVDNLTTQICAHEKSLMNSTEIASTSTSEALYARTEKFKKKEQKDFICKYCGTKGHRVKQCKKWISDGRPPKQATSVNLTLPVLALNQIVADKDSWYVDNGATSHVTNRGDIYETFEHFRGEHTVTAANGQTIEALGKGTIRAEVDVCGRREQITLKDVWYVPNIKMNLFSVLAAHDHEFDTVFESTPDTCILKVAGYTRLIGKRQRNGGLYKLNLSCLTPKINVNAVLTNPLQVYHERLAHQNKRHVKQLIEQEFGLKVEDNKSDLCEGCLYGKAHKQKFGTRIRATQPGELIHADICGPFTYSIQKFRYFLMFKDDFTHYRFIYFLKQKSEAWMKLKQMLAEAKVAGHTVKEILTDNGGEFDNEQFRKILAEHGVKQRLTMPHTHEQAGCVERENRTIVEAARSMMHAHEELPQGLWAELINTAAYILNRTGSSSVQGKSPYELWYNKKPGIKHLRIIGCKCYAHIPKSNRMKLDKKAQKGILIGYDGNEGYRIWDKVNHKLIRSRDVTFEETPLLGCNTEKETLIEPQPSTSTNKTIRYELPDLQDKPSDMTMQQDDTRDQQASTNVPLLNGTPLFQCEYNEVDEEDEHVVRDVQEVQDVQLEPNHIENESFETVESEDEDTEHENRSLTEPEIEQAGRMTLRNRDNLRPPSRYRDHVCNINLTLNAAEPKTFKEAMSGVDREKWQEAINSEINSLEENETWELVELPKGRKAIPCKWLFKIKTNADGTLDKYKARLVIKGYSQKEGLDFYETFSPVARSSTIRALLSVAAKEKMSLSQFDVSTAFLYGKLDEEIYMKPPEGYATNPKLVFKLKKSLYGLKQAPRCWNRCITDYIVDIGFKQSKADPCLFTRRRGKSKIVLALYVDDGLFASNSEKETKLFLEELKNRFKITVKPANYFLGMEIERHTDGSIFVHQKAYTKRVLERFGMENCKAVATPILKQANKNDTEAAAAPFPYRQAVGALAYLMTGTRPDIAYAISVVSRNLDSPTKENVQTAKRIFRYLKGTIGKGITYASNKALECYSDADHGGDLDTGRSTSGMLCLFAGGPISWQSKRQLTVAISSTEAEIVAASETAREIVWMKRILKDLTDKEWPATLYMDSEPAIQLANHPAHEYHQRTKHIRIRSFFVRQCVESKILAVCKVPASVQLADMLTKPLYGPRLSELSKMSGLKTEPDIKES